MMRNHDLVAEAGGNAAVININSIGMGAMAFLRKRSKLVLHAHRNGWDILTRHPSLGMDFSVYGTIWRLLGVDQFQINGIGAKYWEPDDSFIRSFRSLQKPIFRTPTARSVVCSGQWGGQAPATWDAVRTTNIMYLCGGGVVSHPGGRARAFAPCGRPGKRPSRAFRWRPTPPIIPSLPPRSIRSPLARAPDPMERAMTSPLLITSMATISPARPT